MEKVNGAGVTERSEDWTIRSVFEDWIGCTSGERERKEGLSRRKKAFLETTHTQMVHNLEYESVMEPNVAPSWMSDELDKSHLIFECQCVADLLDFVSPVKDGKQTRANHISDLLDEHAFL